MRQPDRTAAVVALLCVPGLALLTPSTDGPTGPLLAAVAGVAWLLTAWLAAVALLSAASRLPGALGHAAAGAARRSAPAAVRRLVGAAVGASLVLSATAALAEDRPPTVAGSAADSLDWPGLAPVTALPPARTARTTPPTGPATPRPTAAPPAAPRATPLAAPPVAAPAEEPRPAAVPAPRGTTVTVTVTVQPGDSLWSIAARHLGAASDRQVAAAWPRWWAANRPVVGDDPDLIHPGDRLTAP